MPKDIVWYLSRGFDAKTAAYFAAGRRKLVEVEAQHDFTLMLTFDSGEKRLLDMKSTIVAGTVFAPLAAPDVFNRVYLDSTGSPAWDIDPDVDSEVVWNNKIDLSPDTCYLDSIPLA